MAKKEAAKRVKLGKLGANVPLEFKRKVKVYAARNGVNMQDLVVTAVEDYMRRGEA